MSAKLRLLVAATGMMVTRAHDGSTVRAIVRGLGTLSLLCSVASSQTPMTATRIPFVSHLIVTDAVQASEGDYESMATVGDSSSRGFSIVISGDAPQAAGQPPVGVSVGRTVQVIDMKNARTWKYWFNESDADVFPGTTAIGLSGSTIVDLRAHGSAELTLDGSAGGMAGEIGDMLAGMGQANPLKSVLGTRMKASGTVKLVESKPLLVPVLVNGSMTPLAAWHMRGHLGQGDQGEDADLLVLDDPANPLTLNATIGADKVQVVRIDFPIQDPAGTLERTLAKDRRAALYGIYFDFNSATIKPASEPVLREIVAVMKGEPTWTLKVEGHTDNVGGDAKNLDLSSRRAAAVKAALVARGVPAARLDTGGYGASVPKETNATLQGRARNRRVELSRQ